MKARIVESHVEIGERGELTHRIRVLLSDGMHLQLTLTDPDYGQPRDAPRWPRIFTAIRRALRPGRRR